MKTLKILLLVLFVPFIVACSEPSMEDDARAAADLSRISNQCLLENDVAGAGKAYNEVQEIMDKYRDLNKFDEFYQMYGSFLEESASIEDAKMEQQLGQDSTAEKPEKK